MIFERVMFGSLSVLDCKRIRGIFGKRRLLLNKAHVADDTIRILALDI